MLKTTNGCRAITGILAVMVLGLTLAAPASAARARAVFNETKFDFGKIAAGEEVSHEFVFVNQGDAALIIKGVESTCGCTAALAAADRIEPGKEGRIKATFRSGGYDGRVTKHIILHSNDAGEPDRELTITGEVVQKPGPRIEPDRYDIALGARLEGETPAAKLVIRNVGQRELSVQIQHPLIGFFIKGKIMPLPLDIPAGESREIELRISTENRAGMFRDYILLKSNDPLRSNISVSINGFIMTKAELKELFDRYKNVIEER